MGDAAEDGFAGDYLDALRRHVEAPTEGSLQDAYELGRRALVDGRSLLELVAVHQRLLGEALGPVPEGLERADAFLREGLASFEIAGLGVREVRALAAAERERTEVLGHLSDA